MTLQTNISQQEEPKKTEQNKISALSKENDAKMITIDKVIAEKFMLAIEECVGDIEEQKNLVDKLLESKQNELDKFQSETITKFNALIDATSSLSEKIKATESYEEYLKKQVENANLSKEVTLLEQQLQKEKSEVTLFIRDLTNTVTLKLGEMETVVQNLKSADEVIEENIARFKDEMTKETENYEKSADSKLDDIGDHIQKAADSQINTMKIDCEEMLKKYTEKCQSHLDIVKKQSIDFLKQCADENKKLIEKVPAVAEKKVSKKDIVIFAMAGITILSVAVQMIM